MTSSSPLPRRTPRTLKQHLMRRLMVVLPAALLMWVIMKTGMMNAVYDKMTFKDLSWFDNTALVEHLRTRLIQDGLTDLPGQCLVFLVNGADKDPVTIEVLGREGNGCPGAKPDAKTLFKVRVERGARRMFSDANNPGHFQAFQ
ncbi:hypothetical protein [Oecophyllibacter saccharovorans]|nr:hypothetical protein [Oecophyllibacter saccharovorans]